MCNFNFSIEDKNVHSSAWFISECKTDTVSIQTQEVWHEESNQEYMSQNTQQTA